MKKGLVLEGGGTKGAYQIGAFKAFKDLGIKFYCGFPITTYHELRWWIARGVEYVRLGAPLFFDLPNVVKITRKTPIRAVANVAWYDSDPCDDPKVGTWIRPEDVEKYY